MWINKPSKKSQLREGIISIYRTALRSDIPLDQVESRVLKLSQRLNVTSNFEKKAVNQKAKKLKREVPFTMRIISTALPVGLICMGLFLIGNAVIPIVTYYASTLPNIRSGQLQAPIPPEDVIQGVPKVFATTVESPFESIAPEPVMLTGQLDFTNLSNWFTGLPSPTVSEEHEYTISIPSVDIYNARVKVGGTNLNSSLIQYPGTALPGQSGAPVIFGHSVLRQFYNPDEDNKRRYISIFSYIMTLKEGEKIILRDGEVTYTYEVVEKLEIKPEDTYILAQNQDEKLLKLITCVPEGTYLRRGVVIAQLIK